MTKLQGSDESRLLCNTILFTLDGILPCDPPNKFAVQDFGLSARDALSPDMLVKHLVNKVQSEGWHSPIQTTVEAFLCYNWKRRLPFVVVKHRVDHKESYYTPQYGRDANYASRSWSDTKYKICALEQLPTQCPEIASVLEQLE